MFEMMMNNGTGGGMHMTFYVGVEATILFSTWTTHNWQTMLGSCIVIICASVLYEGLKYFRLYLVELASSQSSQRLPSRADTDSLTSGGAGRETGGDDDLLITVTPTSRWTRAYSRRTVQCIFHILQTVLHFIQVSLGYLLMLVAMTFNVYLFLALALGASLGYLIFNYRTKTPVVVDRNDPCH